MAFTDIMGDYLQRRMDTAVQPFTDPEAYLRQRLLDDEEERRRREREEAARLQAEQQAAQQRAAEQAQQVQETVQQPQTPTGIAGMPQVAEMPGAAPVTGPVQPQPVAPAMGGPAPMVQDQANIEEQRRIEQAQAAQAAQAAQPAVPVAPVAPAQPQPQMAQQPQMAPQPVPQVQLPQPGPSVQVAGPAVAPPEPGVGVLRPPAGMVAPAPQPQPQLSFAERIAQAGQKLAGAAPAAAETAAAAPDYSASLGGIASDPAKLAAFYADTNNPEPARKIAAQLWRSHLEGTSSQDRAEKTLVAAAQGDPRAQSEVMRDLKRDEGSYVKAVLFARLGLNKLAEQEQEKLGQTGRTVSRALLGTEGYTVEQDSRGAIVRAWDSEGNRVGDRTLAQLNASGMKQGSQAFGFAGGRAVIPSTNEPVIGRTNSITGQAEYVYMTGPRRGQIYTGTETPVAERVGTQAMVDYNRKMIDFNTNPNIAAATELYKAAAMADPGDGSEIAKVKNQIGKTLGIQALNQIVGSVPAVTPPAAQAPAAAPVAPVAPAAQAPAAQPVITRAPAPAATGAAPATAPAVTAGAAPAAGGRRPGESFDAYKKRIALEQTAGEARIQEQKEVNVAERKPGAEARGKQEAKDINNQAYADSTYELIRPIANLIKQSTGSGIGAKVDSLASVIGVSPEGAQAISELEVLSYPILSNVPRFEGPQSDYDVKTYQKAAGDFANAEKPIKTRLAALQSMVNLLKKYDKAGKNDWTFGESQQPAPSTGGIRIINREKVR